MSAVILNEVRKGTYLDSVALMRLSRTIAGRDGVEEAALMMGTPANHQILADAGLLADAGRTAGGGDLILAVRAADQASAEAALLAAKSDLDAPKSGGGADEALERPRSIRAATRMAPSANIALISVPGAFAAAEARKALREGLHVMIFSDNVAIADEAAIKQEALAAGRLVMGPDCGTAIIAGVPLAFANAMPRGDIGIVGASGTGIQEVTALIAQMGGGISHAIGTGGRDLKAEVGGVTALMAIEALTTDKATSQILVIAKPPAPEIARLVLERLAGSGKPAIVCFMGAAPMEMPGQVRQVFTLQEAACAAMGQTVTPASTSALTRREGAILGLYSGGTLCAEAQVIMRDAGLSVCSNAPVNGIAASRSGDCVLLDLGDDEFTAGKPHPMIDPAIREAPLAAALARADLAAILVDVVIGYGAHPDPAGALADATCAHRRKDSAQVIASVTGTDDDPQGRAAQIEKLEAAGIHVAPSNADAARWALVTAKRG